MSCGPGARATGSTATAGWPTSAPRFAALLVLAALGSLGLPGLSGFVAELQIFAGSIATVPVALRWASSGSC